MSRAPAQVLIGLPNCWALHRLVAEDGVRDRQRHYGHLAHPVKCVAPLSMASPSRRWYAEGSGIAMKSASYKALQGMEGKSHGTHLGSDDEAPAGTRAPAGGPGRMCPRA